jgi:hypothetical protein
MLTSYAKLPIPIKRKGAVNGYNEPTLTAGTIRGRMQYKHRLVRNTQGELVQSETQIFTEQPVALGDVITIDGEDIPVISVETITDLDDVIQWYEVYL